MARCRDCQAPISFKLTANGRQMPVDPDGETPHPMPCPKSRRNNRPVVPDNLCAACGSDNVEREPGRGPHFGALRCLDCGSHRWLRRPEGVAP